MTKRVQEVDFVTKLSEFLDKFDNYCSKCTQTCEYDNQDIYRPNLLTYASTGSCPMFEARLDSCDRCIYKCSCSSKKFYEHFKKNVCTRLKKSKSS